MKMLYKSPDIPVCPKTVYVEIKSEGMIAKSIVYQEFKMCVLSRFQSWSRRISTRRPQCLVARC
jgi:hypothetical protein